MSMEKFLKWFYSLPQVGKGEQVIEVKSQLILEIAESDVLGLWLRLPGKSTRGFCTSYKEVHIENGNIKKSDIRRIFKRLIQVYLYQAWLATPDPKFMHKIGYLCI